MEPPEHDTRPSDYFEREETTDLDDKTPDKPKGLPLHLRILIGLGVGIGAGLLANALFGANDTRVQWCIANITEPVGQIFLRLLLMIVVPLVLSSLVTGIAGLGDIRKIGRIGVRALLYSLVISTISVVIGLTLANVIRPGDRVDPASRAKIEERYALAASKEVEQAGQTAGANKDSALVQVVKLIVPSNPIAAIASDPPNMLQLMFFSLALGIATTLVPSPVSAPFVRGLQALYEITAKIIDIAMKFAPYAVACLLFNNTARFGIDLLNALGLVRYHRAYRAEPANVWRLFPLRRIARASFTSRFFPSHQNNYPDRVLHFFLERDATDRVARNRGKSRSAARDQQLCSHGRRNGQPKRHRHL